MCWFAVSTARATMWYFPAAIPVAPLVLSVSTTFQNVQPKFLLVPQSRRLNLATVRHRCGVALHHTVSSQRVPENIEYVISIAFLDVNSTLPGVPVGSAGVGTAVGVNSASIQPGSRRTTTTPRPRCSSARWSCKKRMTAVQVVRVPNLLSPCIMLELADFNTGRLPFGKCCK